MADKNSKNHNREDILEAIGAILTLVGYGYSSWFAYNVVDVLLAGSGFDSSPNTSDTTDVASTFGPAEDNTPALTTLGLMLGAPVVSSTAGSLEDDFYEIWIVRFHDQKVYEKVEKRAKYLYDKYNNSHIKEKDEGATLIAVDEETAKLINSLASIKTKKELIMAIESLQEVLNDKKYESKLARTRNGKSNK